MKVLVTGASGLVGRHVVEQLAAAADVRALTRDADRVRGWAPESVEVVEGDLSAPETLKGALAGVDKVFLFCVPETAAEVTAAAAEAGVSHIVVLSAAAVTIGFDTHHHAVVEQAVKDSGVAWTMVRPGEFMANMLPIWGPMVRENRRVRYPFGDAVMGSPIHEADIADVAVAALTGGDQHQGQEYTLSGPRQYSVREQVAAISSALGEEVVYEEVSREEARDILKGMGGEAAETADLLLGFVDYDGGAPEDGDGQTDQDYSELMKPLPAYKEVMGHDGRTYEQWAKDHVADFVG
ncbi:NmrA family transcriptional regulator [Enemella evansiae]|uniref:SDR family oxidoreductase n=1 Tax=Enemella evansiae TaxID=2016499 RepID=UPI000B96A1D6|nr:NAD(P)H-binding protein [Enemella evansiae]OYO15490.1 NmrA family transcriptional regulator [Enemella evansiae]